MEETPRVGCQESPSKSKAWLHPVLQQLGPSKAQQDSSSNMSSSYAKTLERSAQQAGEEERRAM